MSTSTSTTDRVVVEIADAVAELRLTRGDAGNAIDPAWVTAFDEAVASIEAALVAPRGRAEVRAVLIVAEGRAFTVGGDIKHFVQERERLSDELAAMVIPFNATLVRLAELPIPVVAAVHGPIAGGGLGLAWCSDVVVAAPEAKFATGFHKLGLSGDGGCSWFLPRLVGLRRAQEMLLGGRVLDAAEALEWGLVTEVVPGDALRARAREVAEELATGPSLSLGRTRALLHGAFEISLAEHMRREGEHMRASGATADAIEGVTAFAERRAPVFRAG